MPTLQLQTCVILHLPRTGGMHVYDMLRAACLYEPRVIEDGRHMTRETVESLSEELRRLPKIGVVRHPQDWLASQWAWQKQHHCETWEFKPSFDEDWARFVRNAVERQPGYVQEVYDAYTGTVNDPIAHIGKTETLVDDLVQFLDRCNEPFLRHLLYRHTWGRHESASWFRHETRWTEEMANAFYKANRPPFHRFGYKPYSERYSMNESIKHWRRLQREGYFTSTLLKPEPGRWIRPRLDEWGINVAGKVVCEIGIGYGHEVAMFGDAGRLYGIDVCPEVLNLCKQYLEARDIHPTLYTVDEYEAQMATDEGDIAYSVTMLQHIPKDMQLDYLRWCARWLKPGGFQLHQFLVGDYPDQPEDKPEPHYWWALPDLQETIQTYATDCKMTVLDFDVHEVARYGDGPVYHAYILMKKNKIDAQIMDWWRDPTRPASLIGGVITDEIRKSQEMEIADHDLQDSERLWDERRDQIDQNMTKREDDGE